MGKSPNLMVTGCQGQDSIGIKIKMDLDYPERKNAVQSTRGPGLMRSLAARTLVRSRELNCVMPFRLDCSVVQV